MSSLFKKLNFLVRFWIISFALTSVFILILIFFGGITYFGFIWRLKSSSSTLLTTIIVVPWLFMAIFDFYLIITSMIKLSRFKKKSTNVNVFDCANQMLFSLALILVFTFFIAVYTFSFIVPAICKFYFAFKLKKLKKLSK